MNLVLYIALTLTIFLVLALLLAPLVLKPSVAAKRIREAVKSNRPDQRKVRAEERTREWVLSMANSLRVRLGVTENENVKNRLRNAGLKSEQAAGLYSMSRLAGPVAGIAVGSFIHQQPVFWALALAGVFYMIPDIWLSSKAKKRRERIRKSMPDALDLLVICVDAGLGLDQAMLRVGQELGISHPDITQEFIQINLEQMAGKQRLEAWRSAADRTQIPEFALFVTMLTQADRFGTPIIRALSRFADEIRMKRRQHAEEMAAKAKIKILFPLVLFIFPCIFIVLLAPAMLSIAQNMGSFK